MAPVGGLLVAREKGREAEPWIWWRRSSLGPPWPAHCSASLGGVVERRERGLRHNEVRVSRGGGWLPVLFPQK